MANKPWLRDYFKWLALNIEKNEMQSEKALSRTVEIPIEGWVKRKTLLEALEYDRTNVQAEYSIQIGTSRPRVDFLLGNNKNLWMLDLKKPGESCNKQKNIGQLQSYMSQEKIALGILFNGTNAYAYVNPDHIFIADIIRKISEQELESIPKLNLSNQPVLEAEMKDGNCHELVEFFRLFQVNGNLPDIEAISIKLTEEYIRKIRKGNLKETRSNDIKNALIEILHDPNEKFALSFISSSEKLMEIKTKPTEILEAWACINFSSKPSLKRKINN
ncbi:MAG: type I restriction enzyme HsdR N-terminal domain-containing protein [Syntrophothermus sp.]